MQAVVKLHGKKWQKGRMQNAKCRMGETGASPGVSVSAWCASARTADVDSVGQAIGGVFNILDSPMLEIAPFFGGQCADNLRWRAEHQRAFRHFRVLRDQGLCTDQALRPQFRSVKYNGAHSDQAFVTHAASMHDG